MRFVRRFVKCCKHGVEMLLRTRTNDNMKVLQLFVRDSALTRRIGADAGQRIRAQSEKLCLLAADRSPLVPPLRHRAGVASFKEEIANLGQIVRYMRTFKTMRWSRPLTLSTSPCRRVCETQIAKPTCKRRSEAQSPREIHASLVVMK